MIHAVLFDLDGVLVETRDLHFRALNAALEQHGCRPIDADEHRYSFNGLPTAVKLGRLVAVGRVRQDDVSSIQALKQKETRRLLESEVKFDPGVFCLLWGLRSAGYCIGVVTNAVRDTTDLVLSKLINTNLVLRVPVQLTVSNEDGHPKPAPDLYQIIAHKFGLFPVECLAVEDGKYGIEAATAAGCKVLAVSGPEEVTPQRIWEAIDGRI